MGGTHSFHPPEVGGAVVSFVVLTVKTPSKNFAGITKAGGFFAVTENEMSDRC